MEQLIFSLLLWIGANSNYPVPQHLPRVEHRANDELVVLSHCEGRLPCAIPPGADKVIAFYGLSGPIRGTVFLSRDFDISRNLEHRAILLHELVHHAQVAVGMGKKPNCRGLMEMEARALENKWREENRVVPAAIVIAPAPSGCFRGLPGYGADIPIHPLLLKRMQRR